MLKLFGRYIKKSMPEFIGNIFFLLCQIIILTAYLMPEMKDIIDKGVGRNDMDYIIHSGIRMLLLTAAVGACTVAASYFSAKVTAAVTCRAREDCYDKVLSLSAQDYNHFGGSTLLTRTMADGVQIQLLLINILRTSMMVPIVIVCMLVLISRINMPIFFILAGVFAVTVLLLVFMGARTKPIFEKLQECVDSINLLMHEKLTGVRAIRAFGNQKLEEDKMDGVDDEAYHKALRANKHINFLAPGSLVIMNWAVALIYFVGTNQLKAGLVSISDLLLIFQYLAYFIGSLAVVPVLVNLVPKTSVSCRRINELLDYEANVTNSGQAAADGINEGRIEFDGVCFGYSGTKDVISDMTFTAQPGRTTAFIGVTGSGKSTVMNLIGRLYQLGAGTIKIDGRDINDYDMEYLRRNISYGTQTPMVFQDTVRNNITAYDGTCTEERIRAACEASCFSEVLEGLHDGLDTVMSQGGMNISGGQRQRLSLARTVAKDARIYIFDDTFSALDAKTEAAARANIKKMLSDRTVLMVAQRISTIIDADRIIVLDDGRIAGQGTHEELLASCREYQEIYKTQCYMEKEEV